ncbi:MAG: hypothetical protein AAGF11_01520 [Myxococcota bacterium]
MASRGRVEQGRVALGPTDDFCDLVIHVLAHVPLPEPGNLHDPRYVAWARAHMPASEVRWLYEGAAVFERAWAAGVPPVVHAWPELFGSIEAFMSSAVSELAQLCADDVQAPEILRRAQTMGGPDLELLHATLGALAPWYSQWRAQTVGPWLRESIAAVQPWIDEAQRVLPSLDRVALELAWPLGAHGRAFARRIVVGAPGGWNGLDPCVAAVLFMHERQVRDCGAANYVEAEWSALTGLAVQIRGASARLREAHRAWVASLELSSLLEALGRSGRIAAEDHEALLHDPEGRAERLAVARS